MSIAKAQTVAAAKPRWLVQFETAVARVSVGKSRAAVSPLREALKLNPNLTPGWRMLGDILMASGDFLGARHAFDSRIASMIRDKRLRDAAEAMAGDRLDVAEKNLADMLARNPAAAVAVRQLLGECLRRRNRLTDAEQIFRRCLEEAQEFHEARQSLAQVLLSARRFKEALTEFDMILDSDPSDCRCLAMKAAALTEMDRHGEAARASAAVLEAYPDQPYSWLVHANGLRALGQTAACIAAYGKCIELDPRCAEAYLGLANLKTYRFSAEYLATMQALLARDDLIAEDRAKLHFALGKQNEDAGEFAEAFGNYARGNAIERSRRMYDPAATSAYIRRSSATLPQAIFDVRAGWGASDPDPIFIVGLPRSGSTLVEQILASHPAVEGTHELADLPVIAASVKGYPEGLTMLSREACAKLGTEYLRRTSAYRHLGRPRFIDKTPKNFFHIGLIQLILPNARIVDVRRHPLDCGVSIFRQHFGLGFGCAQDLDHIGKYYADYVDLMAHFDQVLPGKIHRVIYEDLVANTESEVRRLLDFLDLQFDPLCLRFFENRRAVSTPSSEQVRQPVFSDSIGQWRRYEAFLDPLKAALGSVLDAYPDVPAMVSQ